MKFHFEPGSRSYHYEPKGLGVHFEPSLKRLTTPRHKKTETVLLRPVLVKGRPVKDMFITIRCNSIHTR